MAAIYASLFCPANDQKGKEAMCQAEMLQSVAGVFFASSALVTLVSLVKGIAAAAFFPYGFLAVSSLCGAVLSHDIMVMAENTKNLVGDKWKQGQGLLAEFFKGSADKMASQLAHNTWIVDRFLHYTLTEVIQELSTKTGK